MSWFIQLFTQESVAQTVLLLSMVIACGLALGHLRVFGISFSIAGVLFAGLAFGHFQPPINHEVLHFVREFGLILFVYTIGIQVGPAFFASFRKQGIGLNAGATAIVVLGVLTTVAIYFLAKIVLPATVGLLAGAVTNTPSLAAAQQALQGLKEIPEDFAQTTGMAYAIAYPFGVVGVILTMLAVRWLFRIDPAKEAEEFNRAQAQAQPKPENINLELKNPGLVGQPLEKLAALVKPDAVISRFFRDGHVQTPRRDTILQMGDVLHAVGSREGLEKLRLTVGEVSTLDLRTVGSRLTSERILVTHKEVIGETIAELALEARYEATITRIYRAGIEFVPHPGVRLQFGDTVTAVGEADAIKELAAELGNSPKQLNYPNILPIFIGLILGVVVGSIPLSIPGVPAPVKLGLAGGPLLVAILLSRLGNVGPVTWYLPQNANLIVREIGIVLFLTCVGLSSGKNFVNTLMHGDGLYWMACAALITLLPAMLVAIVARWKYKMNYMVICGLVAGSMTDPPALSFANSITSSEAPSITYATVYPWTMFLRVLTVQLLVIFLGT
jgi:putative transport protein